jgi:GNAT superfamily N-acetyltransferase
MSQAPHYTIRRFIPSDQEAVRTLIIEGLAEHFGAIDDRFNHDLDDIASHYTASYFVVAEAKGEIIGTGCLVPQGGDLAQIVRMSTARAHRRRGVGRAVLAALIGHARTAGIHRVILTTNEEWDDAPGFYSASGFTEKTRAGGGVLFEMLL